MKVFAFVVEVGISWSERTAKENVAYIAIGIEMVQPKSQFPISYHSQCSVSLVLRGQLVFSRKMDKKAANVT